jgi:uncharacterized protein (TIGR03382 family)
VTRRILAAGCAAAAGLALCGAGRAQAGPYTETGHAPTTVASWATAVEDSARGPLDIANPGAGNASYGEAGWVLGPATNDAFDVFSLGDGGWILLRFASPIADQPGDDFAVFENGFYAPGGLFAELAYVEVSSNGSDFARFPATSLRATPVSSQEAVDPSDYHNLAGKHPLNRGTGFDLAELAGHPLVAQHKLDLAAVVYVRLVDVIGDGSTLDAAGHPVYDPYPTAYASGGFDADAVGAPEPGATAMLAAGALSLAVLSRRRPACARSR